MFDFRLLRIRSFTAANTAIMAMGTAMGGAMLLLVIFMVNVMGYSELKAALAMTFMPLTALFVAPVAGRLVDRIGPRYFSAVGLALFGVGLVLLAQLGAEASLQDVAWRLVIMGFGMGLSMPSLAAAAMGSLPPSPAASARAPSRRCDRSASFSAWRSPSRSSRTPWSSPRNGLPTMPSATSATSNRKPRRPSPSAS